MVSPGVDADTPNCNLPYARPDGSLIRDTGNGAVYAVEQCMRRYIINPHALDSHRFQGGTGAIRNISSAELSGMVQGASLATREGAIIRYPPNTGDLFIVDELAPGSYPRRKIDYAGWTTLFTPCGSHVIVDISDPNELAAYPWFGNVVTN